MCLGFFAKSFKLPKSNERKGRRSVHSDIRSSRGQAYDIAQPQLRWDFAEQPRYVNGIVVKATQP